MAGDGGEIRPFQRKFDTAWRIGRELIKQIPPARIGLIRRDSAELRLMRDCGLHMNIAHGGSQLTCSLFRESPTHSQLPISNVKVTGN